MESFWVCFVIVGGPAQVDQPFILVCYLFLQVLNVKGISNHWVWEAFILE